jgi:hypothetical protein
MNKPAIFASLFPPSKMGVIYFFGYIRLLSSRLKTLAANHKKHISEENECQETIKLGWEWDLSVSSTKRDCPFQS